MKPPYIFASSLILWNIARASITPKFRLKKWNTFRLTQYLLIRIDSDKKFILWKNELAVGYRVHKKVQAFIIIIKLTSNPNFEKLFLRSLRHSKKKPKNGFLDAPLGRGGCIIGLDSFLFTSICFAKHTQMKMFRMKHFFSHNAHVTLFSKIIHFFIHKRKCYYQ